MLPHADRTPVGGGVRFRVEPRLISPRKAARRLSLTEAEFAAKHADLLALGFPEPYPVIGNYDLVAVDAWLDRQSGLTSANAAKPATASAAEMRARLATLG